jgi:transcriptional regulator GlxA family with amidase domain
MLGRVRSGPLRVAIFVFDGVDELDAIAPYEVLVNGERAGAPIDVRLVTLEAADEVTGSHGLRVRPDGVWDGEADLVIVPGGGWNDRGPEGAWAQAQRGDLPRAVAEHHRAGGHVAAVCTGGMLAAAAGVVGGRPATTHARARDELREAGADVRHDRVVDHGDLITAGGVTSGIDLALWILEREFGERVADAVAREMEYERVAAVRAAGGEG